MAYELGSIWLQVIPSFDGVQDQARDAGRKAAQDYAKAYDDEEKKRRGGREKSAREAGEAEGRARAAGREDALTAAQQRELDHQRQHNGRLAVEDRKAQNNLQRDEKKHHLEVEAEREKHRQGQKAKDADYFRDRQKAEDDHRRNLAKIEAQGQKEMAVAEAKGYTDRRKAEQAHNARMAEARQNHWQDSIAREQAYSEDRTKRAAQLNDKLIELDKRGQNQLAVERERHAGRLERDENAAGRRRQANLARLQNTLLRRALGDPEGFGKAMDRVLERVEKEANLKDRNIHMELDLDSTEADKEIAKFQARLNALRDGTIDIEADTTAAVAELMALAQIAESLDNDDVDIRVNVHMGRAIAELMTLDAATTAAARRQLDLASGTRTADGAAGSAANAFRAMNGVLLAAVTIGPILIPTLLGIAGALGAIATFGLAAVAGIGVGVLGLAGIGDAVGAMGDLETEQQYGGAQASRQARRQTRGADRQVRNARRGVDRARQQASDGLAGATERQERAERSLTRAQEQAERAQERLTRARQQARREIEDMNNALISGAMSERDALYDLEEARYALFRIQQDGSATQRERDRAQLQYDMQAQQYRELQLQNRRNVEDKAAVDDAGGARGLPTVVDAERGVKDAAEGVADAQRAIVDAAADRERAQVDGAQAIADAEERLRDALENQAEVQANLAEGTGPLATAQRKLAEAMDALGPAGQRFAAFLFGLKPLLDELRLAAQEGFLPGLQAGLEMIVDTYGERLTGFVGVFATALGEQATAFGEWMTKPEVQEFFETFGEYMLIFLEQFGEIMPNLFDGLFGVITALLPFTEQFGDALIGLSGAFVEWATSEEGQESLASFFAYLANISPEVWELFVAMVLAIANAIIALAPYTEWLIEEVLTPFLTWIAEMDEGKLRNVLLGVIGLTVAFQGLAFIMSGLLTTIQLLGNLAFLRVIMTKGIGGALGIMTGTGGAAAGGAAATGGKALARGLMRFGLWGLALGGVVLILYELYEHVEPFRNFVDGIVGAITSAWTNYILPVFQAIWGWVVENLGPVFGWLVEQLSFGWDVIVSIFNIGWTLVEIVFKSFQVALELLGLAFSWLVDNVISPVWNALYDNVIRPVWEGAIKPVFEAFSNFISEHVAPPFEAGVQAIGDAWNLLKKMIASPIVAVIGFINNGILEPLNSVLDFFDISGIDPIPVPAAIQAAADWEFDSSNYATGGILPGYTPGRDVHEFVSPTGGRLGLSGGEAIMRPEVARVLGRGGVDALNGAAMRGGTSAVARLLGGTPDGASWVPDWLSSAASSVGNAVGSAASWVADKASYAWDFIIDPVGHLKEVVRSLIDGATNFGGGVGDLVTGIPLGLIDKFGGKLSDMLGGETTAKHMSAAVPKTAGGRIYGAQPHVDSAASLLARWVGGIDLMQAFNQSMAGDHPQGLAVDFIDDNATLNRLAAFATRNAELLGLRYMAWQGRIFTPGRGWTPQTVGYGNDPMHRWHVHISHYPRPSGAAEASPYQQVGGRAPQLRDGGGPIEPGLNYILNATGEREWSFTRQQLDSMRGGTMGGGQTVIDVDIDRPGATAGEIAEEFNFALRRARRGGAYVG